MRRKKSFLLLIAVILIVILVVAYLCSISARRAEKTAVDFVASYPQNSEERYIAALAHEKSFTYDAAENQVQAQLDGTELAPNQTVKYFTVEKPAVTISAENGYTRPVNLIVETCCLWDTKENRSVQILGAAISGAQVSDLYTVRFQFGDVLLTPTPFGMELTVIGSLSYREKNSAATVSGDIEAVQQTQDGRGDEITTGALTFHMTLNAGE